MAARIDEWQEAWDDLGCTSPPASLRQELVDAYSGGDRCYHNLQHIHECFGHFATARSRLENPAEVTLALWFHDAIYDTRRSDNEERSAEWAERAIRDAGGPDPAAGAVRDLILATRHGDPPQSADQCALVDIDLAILAADAARFDEYEHQIRREYAWVPEDEFRSARTRILSRFLDRPHLYATTFFRDRCEAAARENLRRSLERLVKGPT